MKFREIPKLILEVANTFLVKGEGQVDYLDSVYPLRLQEVYSENEKLKKYYDYDVVTIHSAEFVDYVGTLDIYIAKNWNFEKLTIENEEKDEKTH